MFEIARPESKETLQAELDRLHAEIADYAGSFATAEFLAPQGEAWSPAGHLRHLIRSVRAVARGMGLPKLLLGLRFGVSRRPSRSFAEVRELYRAALAGGAQAGSFGPSQRTVEMPDEEWRSLIMERWALAGRELGEALGRWSERALDRYRLPHPILGKLTVREMLYFTLYHNAHHARRVAERAG